MRRAAGRGGGGGGVAPLLLGRELGLVEAGLLAQHAHQVRLLNVEHLALRQRQRDQQQHRLLLQIGQLRQQLHARHEDALLDVAALGLLEGGDLGERDAEDRRDRHARLGAGAPVHAAAAAVAHRRADLDRREGVRRAQHQQRGEDAALGGRELVDVADADEARLQLRALERQRAAHLDALAQPLDPLLAERVGVVHRSVDAGGARVAKLARGEGCGALVHLESQLVRLHLQRHERFERLQVGLLRVEGARLWLVKDGVQRDRQEGADGLGRHGRGAAGRRRRRLLRRRHAVFSRRGRGGSPEKQDSKRRGVVSERNCERRGRRGLGSRAARPAHRRPHYSTCTCNLPRPLATSV